MQGVSGAKSENESQGGLIPNYLKSEHPHNKEIPPVEVSESKECPDDREMAHPRTMFNEHPIGIPNKTPYIPNRIPQNVAH